jgi:hypothetical protein
MHYLIVVQLFCAFFCAFLAGRSGRSRVFWWLVGALVPVLGVAVCLWETRAPAEGPGREGAGPVTGRSRPKRCCGRYIPECWGCPHFRRHLFSTDSEGSKGHCAFYGRDLTVAGPPEGNAATEDDA